VWVTRPVHEWARDRRCEDGRGGGAAGRRLVEEKYFRSSVSR